MIISGRNWIAEAASATHGGTASGTALTNVNVLRRPYAGDIFVSSKLTTGAGGGAYVDFDLGATRRCGFAAAVYPTWASGDTIVVTLRSGGSGGSIVGQAFLTQTVGAGRFQKTLLDGFGSGVNADFARWEWIRSGSSYPQFARFFLGTGLTIATVNTTLAMRDLSTGDRSQAGAWFGVDGGRKREVGIVFDDVDLATAFQAPSGATYESLGQVIARAGQSEEVLVWIDNSWVILGRIINRATVDRNPGPLNRVQITVREF